jgi:hypothetical protein
VVVGPTEVVVVLFTVVAVVEGFELPPHEAETASSSDAAAPIVQ